MAELSTLIFELRGRGLISLAHLLLLAFSTAPLAGDDSTAAESEAEFDFASEIYPIFERRCQSCHGEAQQMGEFRLDSAAVALRGGVSGPNILPGEADASPLFQRIAGVGDRNPMPLTGERLAEDEIALIRTWIDQGAEWPEGIGSGSDEISQHWAYRPPVRRPAPAVRHSDAVRNPIDGFVLARLERDGLVFAPEASRETLVRRVSLDLRGLPPTVGEVDQFLDDKRPGAYERLLDRMLKSPHFGEHWAAYWLDLARFADTNGYESDEPRTMWAYRDWVIDAFNRNLTFDRFTTEQLAGDLLPNATTDQIVATGFHRNTLLNNEAGSKNDEFYDAAVKDRVDTTATVWLGSTVGCAQCHDHKYDPFKQSEYYQLYAIFNNTADSAIKRSVELDVFKGDEDALRRREAEVARAREVLDTPTTELAEAQREWELQTLPSLAAWRTGWTPLGPAGSDSAGDSNLQVLSDASVLVAAAEGGPDVYEVTFEPEPTTLTGLRIEAMRDESLPGGGPGRGEDGAFKLTGIEVEAWTPELREEHERMLENVPEWSSWHVLGPFRVRSREEAFRTAFPPESGVDLAATYEDGHLAWLDRSDWSDGRVHYFGYIPDDAESNCASYAYRTIEVREPTSVLVSLGSHKGLKVWLNSELVLASDPTREIAPDQERVRLDLRPGTNEILLKLTNDRGAYGYHFESFFGAERRARLDFASATADLGEWATADLSPLFDGRAATGWSLDAAGLRQIAKQDAVLRLKRPVDLPAGSLLKVRLIHDGHGDTGRLLGRFRISATSLAVEQLAALQETPNTVQGVLASEPAGRSEDDQERLEAHYRSIAPELEGARRRLAELSESLESFRSAHTTRTLVMRELPEPRATHVQNRGNFMDLDRQVAPGIPAVLAGGGPVTMRDRLDLARWLTADSNPLTARVRVNQIWNRLFGRGLVATAEDFGSQGDPPTHPELLDWLATEFVRLEWDTQALLRTIMTSATYRQDSAFDAERVRKDPSNVLLSRGARYRVGAETVRDIALSSSGQLSRTIGGPSVFPPQPEEVFGEHFIEGGFKIWPTSEGADRYRRGLYTFYKRTIVYPAFMNFDAPDRTVCTVDRSLSNTPLQALNTLNDPAFFEAAQSLAGEMLSEPGLDRAERIHLGFRSVLSRAPATRELERMVDFLERMAASYEARPAQAAEAAGSERRWRTQGVPEAVFAPWVMVANVLLNLDETFTKE
ncbi:MAG: PSD1 and planctomycete cytochrome C domain-containing protein [Bryobacterales bacterium]|nr:PSD1 and planctomycete cytochrome C domain-containing protein [Bryobacterales bacterium]MDE0625750.1 PSD1 and planctomycete cytochrome C domain-containing protein [Bryobacterales bacterium]